MSKGIPTTLVWIDSRDAVIARWDGSAVRLSRLESEVPGHRRSTGHVRHDATTRPGGGGGATATGEPHRLEHLARFLKHVAGRLNPAQQLVIVGPGIIHERLAQAVIEQHHLAPDAEIRTEPAHRMTDDQLRAWVRELAGAPPRRARKPGAITGAAMR
jgi:hypothetical protein